jgi:GMP synthase (glutamine-hydrolysing)
VKARLLVIQHEDACPPGWFAEWLDDVGVALTVIAGHRGDQIPESAAGYDGLLVLGGQMNAYDDVPCPWLVPTRQLIARSVADGTPFLGVCLGHQLAAVALGGTVTKNPAGQATGLTPVALTEAGHEDPLLAAPGPARRAVQLNEDIVAQLPPGAAALAVAPDATVQAARFGERAWGVQFHPEASPEIFASWTQGKPASCWPEGVDIDQVTAEVRSAREELRSSWRPLAERFGEIVVSERTAAREGSVKSFAGSGEPGSTRSAAAG